MELNGTELAYKGTKLMYLWFSNGRADEGLMIDSKALVIVRTREKDMDKKVCPGKEVKR